MKGDLDFFILREDNDADIATILESASVAHGSQYPGEDWFRWKFFGSPWGDSIVALARSKQAAIAGAVAFGLYRLSYAGHPAVGGVSYETFVSPEFRRRGVFTSLLARAQDEARKQGLALLFNFPNTASRRGFENQGWQDMGGIQSWLKPLRPFRVLSRAVISRGRMGPLAPSPASTPKPALMEFLSSLPMSLPNLEGKNIAAPCRDRAFLRWRYVENPMISYDLVRAAPAWTIIRSGTRSGLRETQLMEVYGRENRRNLNLPEFLYLLEAITAFISPDVITVITTPGHPLSKLLPRAGFFRGPSRANFMSCFLGETPGQIQDSRSWAVTTSDIHTF